MEKNLKSGKTVLEKSEEKYRLLIENIPDVVWTTSRDGNTTYISHNVEIVYGYTPGEIYQIKLCNWFERIHPEDVKRVKNEFESLFTSNKRFDVEYRIRRKDGNWIWVHDRAMVTYEKDGVMYADGVFSDITQRKHAMEEIQLLQKMTLGISTSRNLHDALVFALQKVCNATGWVYGEAWNRSPDGTCLGRDPAFYSAIKGLEKFSTCTEGITFPVGVGLPGRAWVEKQPVWVPDVTIDSNYLRASIAREVGLKAGIAFPIIADNEVIAVVVFYKLETEERDERIIKLVSAVITQLGPVIKRKQVKEALLESEEKLKSVLDNTPAVIYVKDIQGKYLLINRQYEVLFHLKKDDVKGKTDYDIWPKQTADALRTNDQKVIEAKKPMEFDEVVQHDDGTHTYISVKFPLRDSSGAVYAVCGISTDITERKSAEEEKAKLREQLYHVRKIESIGVLAGGIAHDFNNILTAIIGYGNLIKMELEKDEPIMDYIQKILELSEKAAALIRGLLAFSGKLIHSPKPVNLNEIVKEVESHLSGVISADIKLKTTLTTKNCTVMADGGQIEQVLMNLATNARDAMPKGGCLTISTDITEMDDEYTKTYGYGEKGKYVLISVSDTGIGMDKETKERIFEPFFTTKEVGKGMGLGLAIVYGIVKQHNGYIHIDSEPDKGTTFKIYLPLIQSAVEKAKAEIQTIHLGGTETILIAEDDNAVRRLTKLLLEDHGYKVIEAVDGEDAINKFKKNEGTIQLLLLDVIMPAKNGKEVYEAIKKINPHIKALFMSGYSKEVINEKLILEEGLSFILKPVSPVTLLRKMREVLNKANSGL